MGLFDPVWKTGNENKITKAIEAVQKISDQTKLAEIAVTAPIGRVQSAAVRKIIDPDILCGIILTADANVSTEAKEAACYQITDERYGFDQRYLLKIAQNSVSFAERAAGKITDQALLKQLALGDTKNEGVKYDAVCNITDPKALAEIAEHARPPQNGGKGVSSDVREFAVERLQEFCRKNYSSGDYRLLRHIAAEAEDPKIRKAAGEALAGLPAEIMQENPGKKPEPPARPNRLKIAEELFTGIENIKGINNLRQIFLSDKREERRVRAFRDIIFNPNFPEDRLPAAYKTARLEAAVPGSSYLWGETGNFIENFIEKKKADNPEFLLRIIKDPECGANLCAACLRTLFRHHDLDTHEGIEVIRDKAVRTFLDNIPAYRTGPEGRAYCIRQLALAIPENYHGRYGLMVRYHAYEDEDQFGRNTAAVTEITFMGQTYRYK